MRDRPSKRVDCHKTSGIGILPEQAVLLLSPASRFA